MPSTRNAPYNSRPAPMPTTPLANVVLRDEPGSLNAVLSMVEKLGINLSAISSSTDGSTGTSIVTLGFENTRDFQNVVRSLRSNGYTVTTRDAFRLFVANQPGSLQSNILRGLSRRGVNIDKIISGTNNSIFVLVDTPDEALNVLRPFLTQPEPEESLVS